MIGDLINHLWQSTLVAVFAALLAAALRNYSANVRYGLWLTASCKFLVPFSLLITFGAHLRWTPAANEIAVPAAPMVLPAMALSPSGALPLAPAALHANLTYSILLGLWLCGVGAIALRRLREWWRIRAIMRTSTPWTIPAILELDIQSGVRVRSCPSLLAPSVVGLWRSVLLVPAGVEERLAPLQLEAVLTHEMCHAQRRDNLTAAIHMIVEIIFWFYPLVWWLGARLLDERERACDEHVLRVCWEPRSYAEGILNICKLYVEPAFPCVSGVTWSTNIKERIENIMNHRIGRQLNIGGKAALVLAALIAISFPVGVGMISAPLLQAQTTNQVCSESDLAIRQELQDADGKILQVDGGLRSETAQMLAQALVDRYPDDFIVHIRYQQWVRPTMQPSALIEHYQALAAAHPGDPMFAILYAQALRQTNAPRAIEVLKSVGKSPYDPWPHLTLAESYSAGRTSDRAAARAHLDAWFGACPTTPNWNALYNLLAYGSPGTMAKEAAALRREFETETDPHLLLSMQFVWELEFQSRPQAELAALRRQISLDVARLESLPAPNDNRWPELLAAGRKLSADPKAQ